MVVLPPHGRGQRIGLLGGSFDPPHAGHVQITRVALAAFDLDHVWWLASPGNPLKAHGPAPMAQRLAAARRLMRHPRVRVTDLERQFGTRFTAETLAALQARAPGVRFVWLMGADNLAQVHRWQRWRSIFGAVPVGVLARPGAGLAARLSPAARALRASRRPQAAARRLGRAGAPDWCYVNLPLMPQSSSAIRARGGWS